MTTLTFPCPRCKRNLEVLDGVAYCEKCRYDYFVTVVPVDGQKDRLLSLDVLRHNTE